MMFADDYRSYILRRIENVFDLTFVLNEFVRDMNRHFMPCLGYIKDYTRQMMVWRLP